MRKVKTVQVGNKLIMMDGEIPLRYVDLTTNKVHQYKEPKKWQRKILRLFKRRLMTDALYYPEMDGFKSIGVQPQFLNILTTTGENMCTWYDGTMRSMFGHDGTCQWRFDGQFWIHI